MPDGELAVPASPGTARPRSGVLARHGSGLALRALALGPLLILAALWLLLSILSAVALSAVIIANHKPGRYEGY